MTEKTDEKKAGWVTIAVLIGFIIYEAITIVLQFVLFFTSDLIEIGFDIVFIMLLVFFYDIDALILLIELIPFVDLIPLFVIYMIAQLATIDQKRKPLIAFDWFKWGEGERKPKIQDAATGSGGGSQAHTVAKVLYALDESGGDAGLIAFDEMVSAEVVVERAILQHVVGSCQQ